MTKSDQENHDPLEQLYAKRKGQYSAPPSIKRQLLAKQRESQSTAHIFKRISYVAVAASTLLLMSLLLIEQSDLVSSKVKYQVVQLHSLETQPGSKSADIKHRYATHYNNYLSQKKTYTAHHKTKAALHLMENGWQLISCDQQVLQLTNELVAALSNLQQIDSQISSGDAVEIAFDQTGIILGITRSGNHLRC